MVETLVPGKFAVYNTTMSNNLSVEGTLSSLFERIWNPLDRPDPKSIDWTANLPLIISDNLGPLVYDLTKDNQDRLPKNVKQILANEYYRSVGFQAQLLEQLTQVKKALSAVSTPLVLIKGSALGATLYRDPWLRGMGDIDFLLPTENVPACKNILTKLEYKPAHFENRPGSFLIHNNQEMFVPSQVNHTAVELHWHILDVPYYLNNLAMDWFWVNLDQLVIGGHTYQVLTTEANLIYLPSHLAFHHRFQGLRSLLDIALMIHQNQTEIKWERVLKTAHSFELISVLGATLQHLAQYWPSLSLEEPLQILADIRPSRNDYRLFHLLTSPARTTSLDFYTTLISLPDFHSRIRYAFMNLFPQPSYMLARYQIKKRWHLGFWYLYRLVGGIVNFLILLPEAWRIDRRNE